jgi:hypothetical protein
VSGADEYPYVIYAFNIARIVRWIELGRFLFIMKHLMISKHMWLSVKFSRESYF